MRPSEAARAWDNGQKPERFDENAEWLPDNEVTAILSWDELRALSDRSVAILDAMGQ